MTDPVLREIEKIRADVQLWISLPAALDPLSYQLCVDAAALVEEFATLRSRLQAAEAERDAAMEEARHLARAANWEDSLPCCNSAASLARVTQLCDEQEAWCNDEYLDVPSWVRSVRAALTGGTSPEPTELACIEDGFGSSWAMCGSDCSLEVVRPGKVQCQGDGEFCLNPRPRYCDSCHRALPHNEREAAACTVDVASEPPKPARTADALREVTEFFTKFNAAEPVGEPLKPTEQEQQ